MKFISGILFLLLSAQPVLSSAKPITDFRDGMLLGPHMRIFEDKAGTATWDDVLAGKHDADFKAQSKPVPNFGSTRSVIWAVVEVNPPLDSSLTKGEAYLLELSHPVLDYVDVVVQASRAKNILNRWETGDLRPFDSRPVSHRNFLFPLGSGAQRVFVKVNSESSMLVPLKIWETQKFHAQDSGILIFLGIYYGIFLVMIIYNFVLGLALKSLSNFLYVGYMLFMGVSQLTLDGIFYEFLPSLGYVNNLGITLWGLTGMIFALAFGYQYLGIRSMSKIHGLPFVIAASVASLGLIMALAFGYRFGLRISFSTGILSPVVAISYGLIRFRQGFQPAGYFLLGFGILALSVLLFMLNRSGIIESSNILLYHAQHVGSAIEAILLSFGLADRIRLIQKEKELAQAATIEQQQILNTAFARFVPTPFLQILGKKSIPEVLLGDYTEREMTVLFADIRGFTTISEKLSPKQTFEFINNYLQGAGPVIRNSGGFIDKYMGDGIMALFEKREDAIAAALRLQARNARLNRSLKGKLVAPLNVGIGIHTGHLMLGTIGEHQRMDGTVISDAVNLASRVESLTKQYGVDLLVTKETLAGILLGTAERPYLRRFIDRIAVKGKSEPTTIYEIIGLKAGRQTKYEVSWLEKWVSAIKLYYKAEFAAANALFSELLETQPTDKAALKFKERCEILITSPPQADWNGVAIATSK